MTRTSYITLMFLSSIFGGIIALAGYFYFVEPIENKNIIQNTSLDVPVSYTSSTSIPSATPVDDRLLTEAPTFTSAASSATQAVVHIRTVYSQKTSSRPMSPFDDFLRDYFGEAPGGSSGPSRGAGSGVLISQDGYIVTNNHVVDEANEISVLLNDNRTFKAKVVGVDPTTDLAVLKIDGTNLPTMKWGDSDKLQLGEWVLAVGNPFEFRSTVTAGIVSAKARNIGILANQNRENNLQIESFIQTDAAVNPGNSGGALVNLSGELVGINTAIISPTGAFAGYSFAVPVSLVKKVYTDLVEFGRVQRALLGIFIADVTAELAEKENIPVLQGVYVNSVRDNSSAKDAGLKEKDVITAINGRNVTNVSELQEMIALRRPGEKVLVSYIRNGEKRQVEVLLKNEQSGTSTLAAITDGFQMDGAKFRGISEKEKEKYQLEGGVVIEEITSGKWKEAGLKQGFIITKVDKKRVLTIQDLADYLQSVKGEGILLEGITSTGSRAYYGIGW